MAARKLKQVAAVVNQAGGQLPGMQQPAAAGQAAKPAPNLVALAATVWETIGRVAEKENRRDDIPDGYSGKVELAIVAKIEGQIYRQNIDAALTVGHKSPSATSSLPNVGAIIGHILAQLNAATRETVLAKLPEIYAANGGELPGVPGEIENAAEGMLSKLRATKPIVKRGSVSVKYQPAQPPLSLVGDF